MANLNRIILVGRLTADPEVRSTVEGLPLAKFRLAVDRPVASGASAADFIDVVAWRRAAEISGEHLKKGLLVLVDGRIQNRTFDDQAGTRHWVTEVVASNLTLLEGAVGKGQEAMGAEETAPEDVELAGDLPF